jgi:hypothetical protein
MAKTLRVRTVRSKDERRRPSVFMRLKPDESFMGFAMFEPDPEIEDQPGYLEYYDHFDKQANQYVPCAGEDCPFCAANDNPSTRAMTVWYFPEAADVSDRVKIFTMNFSTVADITDESEEEGGILGKKIRIRRLDDRGNYKIKLMADKPLLKKQQTEAFEQLDKILQGKGLEGLVESQLRRQMERLKAMDMLEETDDEEEEAAEEESKPTARRGRPAKSKAEVAEEEDEEEEPEAEEDEEAEEESEEDEAEDDEEDEDEEEETEEDEEEEEDDDEDEEIVGVEYEVVRIQRQDEIFDLKDDGGTVKMWLGDGIDVDYDAIKKGATVVVNAAKDEEGDWILTSITLPKPKRGRPARKAAK